MTRNMDVYNYEQIISEEIQEPKPIWYVNGFLIHLVLKAIPIGLYTFDPIISLFFTSLVVRELLLVFVVVDFWFTKNVVGRQLLGLRWFFGQDEYGVEKLMFQCRVNEGYVSSISSKLFWLIQAVYCILPLIGIVATFIISPVLYDVDFTRIAALLTAQIDGTANLYFFIKASSASSDKQYMLREKLGADFVNKLGQASLYSQI